MDVELECWGSVKLWADLPLLGPAFREALDVRQGINFEAFLARITQSGIANWSWLGLCVMHGALEVEPDPRARAYQEQGPGFDATILRAIMWLEIAGVKLYEEVKAGAFRDQKYASGGHWKGPAGFSSERWEYWKNRFGDIGVHEQVCDVTKELARKALDLMTELER